MEQPSYAFDVRDQPDASDRDLILQALVAFNQQAGPPTSAQPLAILVRDEAGRGVGGAWGKSIYDWMAVELFVVPAEARGHGLGTRLMAQVEETARERGCVGIWLDTFSFQAPGFYERLGFARVGAIDAHPVGGARYIYSKRLDR